MLVDTAVQNGHNCCYSRPTIHVGLKNEDAIDGRRLCAVVSRGWTKFAT